jgi:vancomycin resistance protein YoaR
VRKKLIVSSLLVMLTAGAGAGAGLAYWRWLPPGQSLPGMVIGDQVQPNGERLGDWLERRRVALLGRTAYLDLPDGEGNVKTTFGELGIEVDVAETMTRVRELSEEGGVGARLYRLREARAGRLEIPLEWSFDRERARVTLTRLAPSVWRDAVDARLDLKAHRRIDEVPGRKLDVDGTLDLIADAERSGDAVIPLWARPVAARVTSEALAAVDVSKVLGAFETDFSHKARARDKNIAQAAEYLNGTVIAPGQTVSFNEVVGPRRIDRGFVNAPVIVDDEIEPGVGGGTCQVASTLHAAAVYGGMDIVQRRSHSRPSGYTPLGLDATVVYGEVDLKIKNPYDSPLIIHAFLPTKGALRIELLGRDPPGKVEHTYAVIKTHDFYRRVWTKSWLDAGKRIKRQRGIKGYDVVSVVKIKKPDGSEEDKRYFSWYRPVPEVYWVGPGTALGELPELPEGAEHVEVDGAKQPPVDSTAGLIPAESGEATDGAG